MNSSVFLFLGFRLAHKSYLLPEPVQILSTIVDVTDIFGKDGQKLAQAK
jgi:hypothetical protein